jgi:hypothetical protein
LSLNKYYNTEGKKQAYIGMYLPADTINAVKLSIRFSDFKAFRKELEETIHFNSRIVRKNRASNIIKWFFPSNSLNSLPHLVWTAYNDEELLRHILRYQFLISQPVVAKFISNRILPLEPGSYVNNNLFNQFLTSEYDEVKPYLINNLRTNCKSLGFLTDEIKGLCVAEITPPKTAFLIITHFLFSKEKSTIKLSDILQNLYWQYLGIREKQTVRYILHEADAEGQITKYIIADQLEQITTRFSFDEFLQNRLGNKK